MSLDFIKWGDKRKKRLAKIKEKTIEDTFCEYATEKGCKAIKLIFLNRRGFPDRTVLVPNGRVFFVEFKKLGQYQTHTQKQVQDLLKGYGFKYYVCNQVGQAETILRQWLE